jgi:hypothetical protein
VYVDFADRLRFQDPIYLGKIDPTVSSGAPVSSNLAGAGAQAAIQDNDALLNSSEPPGEPLATSEQAPLSPEAAAALDGLASGTLEPSVEILFDETKITPAVPEPGFEPIIFGAPQDEPTDFVSIAPGQLPTPTEPPVPLAADIICNNTSSPLSNGPSCAQFGTNEPGLYDTYSGGIKQSQQQMDRWINSGAANRLVLADSKHSIEIMKRDFIEQTSITDAGVIKFINSGFRAHALQTCYRAKYDACLAEWKRQGSPKGGKPSPVGRPGYSKHQNGAATDFNADGTGRTWKGGRTTALWVWLSVNSEKYGWRWVGKNFNSQEAWHYEYDANLAQASGVLGRQ